MELGIKKKLIRFLLIPIIGLIVLVGIAAIILYSQQERLVKLAVKEVNKQLQGEVVVGGSSISLFQSFPYISIGLDNVQFYASKRKALKPIYEAERMYVGFSLPDILKQRYRVKVIVLKNGHLDIVQDKQGRLNIVEASKMTADTVATTETTSTELDLDVKKVILKNLDVTYLDKQSGHRVAAHIERIKSAFSIDSLLINANLEGKMIVDYTSPLDTS